MSKECEVMLLEKRNVYGNERFFPKCDNARKVLDLMGKNSFSQWELSKVEKLGYIIMPWSWAVDELSTEPPIRLSGNLVDCGSTQY